MLWAVSYFFVFVAVAKANEDLRPGQTGVVALAAPEPVSDPDVLTAEVEGLNIVCSPRIRCLPYLANLDALMDSLRSDEEKRSGYLFRSRRGFESDSEEDSDMEKRGGSHGYLLRTRKSDASAETKPRNTRGGYLFRTRKSADNVVMPERSSRGAGYLFRTRKSVENDETNEENAAEHEFQSRMLRSSKGYLFRTRKSMVELPVREMRGGSYLFRT